jgi:SAM-dependent methyltransferase
VELIGADAVGDNRHMATSTQPHPSFTDIARATWSAGDYAAVATHIEPVGERAVRHAGVRAGETVLDVACGTGNARLPAARTGARVTGLDLTPELLARARQRAAEAGLDIDFVEGDAEALPFPDAGFDVVLSTFGVIFAPHPEQAARELLRVLRPGVQPRDDRVPARHVRGGLGVVHDELRAAHQGAGTTGAQGPVAGARRGAGRAVRAVEPGRPGADHLSRRVPRRPSASARVTHR